jgi:hypothetical protein
LAKLDFNSTLLELAKGGLRVVKAMMNEELDVWVRE